MNPKEAKIIIEYTYLRSNIRKNSVGVVGRQVSLSFYQKRVTTLNGEKILQ